ncbi:dTDP-4-dehydrorhamnose 3,5-epimerase [Breznakibacter xylanolyticus]|uniref:dTDP-4-dehydrorhamnose 3,5-epimerase n=1 Tax=Breznakibacter xylanolyticus TaxID=990 RepID=A0A2W7NRB4_9BACT|nr:dTDP-4-dehydrorhamnose 3,5-epimerase [Breznakibacter xylanolyticus]PZX19154.1 dTDP-4-dehydrorhamnose 3,5-epimerase [Breznakibacter xylanolyticus]
MNFVSTPISGLTIIEPRVFGDERGYFFESFNLNTFRKHIGDIHFVQDNESKSSHGVLRGLHFQKPPFDQAKLVRCVSGEVLDVAVDIRKGSPTYGQHVSVLLSGENKRQFFIPRGFAHGFVVLSESAVFAYKVDNWYAPTHDAGIAWNDAALGIDWQVDLSKILVSEKDGKLPCLGEMETPFRVE